MPGDYYVWSVEGKPVRVHVSLSVVERLAAQAIDAFRVSPANPREVGGVLLGRAMQDGRQRVLLVDDFEPLQQLPAKLMPIRDLAPVGMYRGRGGDDLRLDVEDADVVAKLFKSPDLLYLLVLPQAGAPPRAAIFIQERGKINGFAPYREFPFHAKLLGAGVYPTVEGWTGRARRSAAFPGLAALAIAGATLLPFAWYRMNTDSSQGEAAQVAAEAAALAEFSAPSSTPGPAVPPKPSPPASKAAPVVERRTPTVRSTAATFSLDPVRPNRLQRWVQKVPGLRAINGRRYRDGDRFEPAKPLRQSAPVVSGELAESLTRDVPVQLRLRVDKRGRVSEVDVVNDGSGHAELTQLAAAAAERWSFKPARLNNQPVDSDVMARFRFRPIQ